MAAPSREKSLLDLVDLRARRAVHQARRLALWLVRPGEFTAPSLADGELPVRVAEVRRPIRRTGADVQPLFEEGKRRNVALAAPFFDGLGVTPERPLSFWRALGRVTAARGFTYGMELRGGCVVPSVGGGICLLSNALFELAARAGWTILERHGHSIEAVPGGPALDATVLWPHVDLRVAPRRGPARLEVAVRGDELVLAAYAAAPPDERVEVAVVDERIEAAGGERFRLGRVVRRRFDARTGAPVAVEEIGRNRRRLLHDGELGRSCLTCGEEGCRDRVVPPPLLAVGHARR